MAASGSGARGNVKRFVSDSSLWTFPGNRFMMTLFKSSNAELTNECKPHVGFFRVHQKFKTSHTMTLRDVFATKNKMPISSVDFRVDYRTGQ